MWGWERGATFGPALAAGGCVGCLAAGQLREPRSHLEPLRGPFRRGHQSGVSPTATVSNYWGRSAGWSASQGQRCLPNCARRLGPSHTLVYSHPHSPLARRCVSWSDADSPNQKRARCLPATGIPKRLWIVRASPRITWRKGERSLDFDLLKCEMKISTSASCQPARQKSKHITERASIPSDVSIRKILQKDIHWSHFGVTAIRQSHHKRATGQVIVGGVRRGAVRAARCRKAGGS